MKHIVFITIALFFIIYKTFALKHLERCDVDIDFRGITFLANNQVSLTVYGPNSVRSHGYFPCCLQQGPMIINNYMFYYNGSIIYTVSTGPTWENGYTMSSILNTDSCFDPKFDCNDLYEGEHTYTRVDSYDPKKFPAYGETVGMSVTVYAQCFNHFETICIYSCDFATNVPYKPPQ